jgi:predicted N-acetyltransferase YhbS
VFTAESARKKGIAGRVLEHTLRDMIDRGMELSLLFAGQRDFYARYGWRSWRSERTVLRLADPSSPPADPPGLEIAPFDWERDFDAVRAIHSAYSASRSGTVVRDDALWAASFRLAGNPAEEFRVARRDGRVVAYVRATLLYEILTVTELGRLDDAQEALAALLTKLLMPRDSDPLAPPGKTSRETRAFAVLPAFDDLALTLALETRRVTTSPVEDPSGMLACLNVEALARRLDVSLLPGETGGEFLARILPPGHLVFWPADRF